MVKQQYKKGNRFFWLGFLLSILFRGLPLFSTPDTFPSLAPFVPIFGILSLISLIISIYGLLLVLKSRGRHWAWIFLLIPLNVLGAIIIYMLKDKSIQENPAQI